MKKTTKKVGKEIRTTRKVGAAPYNHLNDEIEEYSQPITLTEILICVAVALGLIILFAHPYIMTSSFLNECDKHGIIDALYCR